MCMQTSCPVVCWLLACLVVCLFSCLLASCLLVNHHGQHLHHLLNHPYHLLYHKGESQMSFHNHMFMFGLKTVGPPEEPDMAVNMHTRFILNAWCIVDELSIRCDRSHTHQYLFVSGPAKRPSTQTGFAKQFAAALPGRRHMM